MGISNVVRDLDVAFIKCYTDGTNQFSKVVLLDGKVQWFDSSDVALSAMPSGTLVGCDDNVYSHQFVELCDVTGSTSVKFVRRYTSIDNEAAISFLDYTLQGVAYTPVGTPQMCDQSQLEISYNGAESAANGGAVTVPAGVKSISIVNMGIDGNGIINESIVLSGAATYTIPNIVSIHNIGVEEDEDVLKNVALVVTPAASSKVFVSWTF